MSEITNAIARLQDISQALTGISIKAAPDQPTEAAPPFPCSLAHLATGEFWAEGPMVHDAPVVQVDFMFNRTNMKQAYIDADTVAIEYSSRLVGDPTLNSKVTSIRLDRDIHPNYEVFEDVTWGAVHLFMLRFSVPLKILDAPTT